MFSFVDYDACGVTSYEMNAKLCRNFGIGEKLNLNPKRLGMAKKVSCDKMEGRESDCMIE